ncbi:helix-turn-helix domain-containing protein, partial [Pantoea trifolii]|uniref:helix-turn-helix domain-containing protein n=1 Tax=Pantoea trifolii TaxID=2968030 RepID=UPI003ED9DCF7
MPWTETVTMQRLDFIRACEAGTHSISELCRLHGISRKTGYKWLHRFNPGDVKSLDDRSHARLTQPEKIPADVADRLVLCRMQHPDWGPKKIRHWFLNHNADFIVPAASTIGDLLSKEKLVRERPTRKRTPGNMQKLT